MNSVIGRYRRQRVPSPTHCEPKPQPCSTCGMLECLCRPRFFAGQMLTADDLNRLDYYIRGKHRLHNRQLHGWGVVNGLEVTCDVCGPGVAVSCGYALGPCGEDIVVCDPVVVDVCALIHECKGAQRAELCDPPRHPSPAGCEQGEQEWILAIRYSESPTRAIKPLMPASATDCGCTGPSKSGCGCGGGCNGNGGGKCGCSTSAKTRPRTAPVQCEPTVVCEGFEFAVYRKPPDEDDDDKRVDLNPDSELLRRFECCSELLLRRIPKMPGSLTSDEVQANTAAWSDWACRFKEYLQDYLSSRPGYNCALLARLGTVICPPSQGENAAQLILQTAFLLLVIWLDALLACFCSALLPPCPVANPSDLVPLASIRVTGNPCRVLSICNWTVHRKFATTFPALQYWLSILPFGRALRELIDTICCFQITGVTPARGEIDSTAGIATHDVRTHAPASAFADVQPHLHDRASKRLNPAIANPQRLKTATTMAGKAYARGKTLLDPRTLFESVFLPDAAKGAEHLSAIELQNLPQFFAFNEMMRPMAAETIGLDAIAPVLAAMHGGADHGAAAEASGMEQLKKEMAGLRADLKLQAAEIRRLKAASAQDATRAKGRNATGKGRKEK